MNDRTQAPGASSQAIPSASGTLDLNSYVCVFLALHRLRLCGRLVTENRRGWRRLFVLDGQTVGFASSFPQEQVGRTLLAAGAVPKARIQWFEERLGPDEPIEMALLASGALSPEQLEEHELGRLRQGIAAPLRAATGTWRFEPCPGLLPERIAAELRPRTSSVRDLWDAVKQHVPLDKVLPEVTDAKLGSLRPGPGLQELLAVLALDPPLSFLAEALGDAITVEELFRQIPDRSGDLLRLVWMLERGGLLLRSDGPGTAEIDRELRAACARAENPELIQALLDEARARGASTGSARQPEAVSAQRRALVEAVSSSTSRSQGGAEDEETTVTPETCDSGSRRSSATLSREAAPSAVASRPERGGDAAFLVAEHRKRMDRDFYGFLGLKPGSPQAVALRRCELMLERWQDLDEKALDDQSRQLRQQLLQGLQVVWHAFSHPDRKDEYDRRLREGHPQRVAEILQAIERLEPLAPVPPTAPTAAIEEDDPSEQLRRLMARSNWAAAVQVLERMRRENPSSPEVLADLGWCAWKARGRDESSDSDPEDYIALALTFAPRSVKALEYYARMAHERGDQEVLQGRLDRLLAVDKGNAWALEVLAGETSPLASSRKSGGGFRFWRRRSDG